MKEEIILQPQENKMGTERVSKLIAGMALPAMFSMLIQALYNIVDSIYVAKLSQDALTAVSLAFPLQSLIIALGVGTGVGVNSLIARRLGAGNRDAASAAARHGLVLAVISGLVYGLVCFLIMKPFFGAFTSGQPAIYEQGVRYGYIVTVLSVFAMVSIACEKIIQGTGNMVIPMIQNVTGAVVNIILDPIMIFGLLGCPKMGIVGAAVATVIGQVVSMVLGLCFLFLRKQEIDIGFRGFRLDGSVILQIYQVGLPGIVMQSVMSVMTAGLNGILAGYSATAVAVLGIYFKLQSFVFMPVFGLNQGALPVMGYNFGARRRERMMQAYKVSLAAAAAIMAAGTALFQLAPGLMLSLFQSSEEAALGAASPLMQMGVPALRTISICFIPAAFGIINSTVFQAIGRGMNSLIVSVCRQLVIILPAAWLFGKWWGVNGTWYAFPFAEIFTLVLSFVLLYRDYKEEISKLEA
ncbi:MATE family efflux transporter [Clostridiaceae bacterium]|nr:MATE family efflux transporter [Clostridiaceae bacterium]